MLFTKSNLRSRRLENNNKKSLHRFRRNSKKSGRENLKTQIKLP